jgi:tetratricopeptide (TPR) repeat protein
MTKDDKGAISLGRDVEKQCATISDDLIHGRSLIVLGLVLVDLGYREEALRHLELAKLKVTGSNFLLSGTFCTIAILHYKDNRLLEALDAMKEAWELAESSNSLVTQAQGSLHYGAILFSANRDAEAWKYIEISLMKNSLLGSQRDKATALEYMGYGYLRRGDYLNAYGAYEAAAENYRGTDEELYCQTCKDNMVKVKDKQKNPDLDVGFVRPRFDMNWPSLFYSAGQDISR